jgi:hypothetical protein
MRRTQMPDNTEQQPCPRCKGTGTNDETSQLGYPGSNCYYCLGTGNAPDNSNIHPSANTEQQAVGVEDVRKAIARQFVASHNDDRIAVDWPDVFADKIMQLISRHYIAKEAVTGPDLHQAIEAIRDIKLLDDNGMEYSLESLDNGAVLQQITAIVRASLAKQRADELQGLIGSKRWNSSVKVEEIKDRIVDLKRQYQALNLDSDTEAKK